MDTTVDKWKCITVFLNYLLRTPPVNWRCEIQISIRRFFFSIIFSGALADLSDLYLYVVDI